MSVKLRLTRVGRRKAPYYRIVAIDHRDKRDGRFIEILGHYQPLNPKADEQILVETDRILDWLKKGALPSDTVRSLLRKKGILKAYHEHQVQEARQRKAAAAA